MIYLLIPVLMAGMITDEKANGNLQLLLTTQLSVFELIISKLMQRLLQILPFVLLALPPLMFAAGQIGLPFSLVVGHFCTSLLPMAGFPAISVLVSVWCRQTRQAVLITYLICGGFFITSLLVNRLVQMPAVTWNSGSFGWKLLHNAIEFLNLLTPEYAAHQFRGDKIAQGYICLLQSLLAWSLVSGLCLWIACQRLRPAYLRQLGHDSITRKSWKVKRPPVSDQPLRWKEHYTQGLIRLNLFHNQRLFWLGLTFLLTQLVFLFFLFELYSPRSLGMILDAIQRRDFSALAAWANNGFWSGNFIAVSYLMCNIFILMVALRSSGCITSEREKQTWESLLLSPLETEELVRGKLWGVLDALVPYWHTYAVAALPWALLGGESTFFFHLIMYCSTLIMIYLIDAVGIYCSATSRSSWSSLLKTLVFSYLGGSVLSCFMVPVIGIVSALLGLFWRLC